MIAALQKPAPLLSLRAFGRALASNPNDVLIGFLQPAIQMDQPVLLSDGRFAGAVLYALTRSNGTITSVTFELLGNTRGEGAVVLRDDGDWQIPPQVLGAGTTTIIATAHTADGLTAQAQIIAIFPGSAQPLPNTP